MTTLPTTPARAANTGTVQYDPDRSTRYVALYPTQSSRFPDLWYPVRHELRTGLWSCPCPARVAECRHVIAAREFERLRWWSVLIADMQPQHRDEFLAVLRSRLGSVYATDDDRVAWAALVAWRAGRRVAA